MNHRWVARALVVGLHAALLAALWLHKPARLPASEDRRMTLVRVVTAPPQRVPPSPPEPIVPRLSRPADPGLIPPLPVPTESPSPASPATAPTAPPAADPAEPPRTTLRLTLPPGYAASAAAARNPALTDPRSNTARRTMEDRIADALGGSTGEWLEERTSDNRSQAVGAQGDHRTVMRRGDTCVEIFRSRIADMDSFNGNVAPRAVSMMGKPYKCK
jgi:type IV secretory pathway VirB10-like protein